MDTYVAPEWRTVLMQNRLTDFDAWWSWPEEWFETPNRRRGGWSGVSRCTLCLPEGDAVNLFLKRQENHTCRSLRHPLRGVPTLERELANIRRCRRAGELAARPVFYASQVFSGRLR